MNTFRALGKFSSTPRLRVATLEEVRALHAEVETTDIPMCLTQGVIDPMAGTIGRERPETGAKLFGPVDGQGADVFEYDHAGSKRAGSTVYAPDVLWGMSRIDYWLSQPGSERRLWTGDVHSHPGSCGLPSRAVGQGLGDMGYVREVFAANEWLAVFLAPILTHGRGDEVVLCMRSTIHAKIRLDRRRPLSRRPRHCPAGRPVRPSPRRPPRRGRPSSVRG